MSKLINISWEKYKTCIFVFISLWYIYQFWSMILKKYITNKKCTIFLKYTLWRFTNTKWKWFTHKRNIYRCHHFLGMNISWILLYMHFYDFGCSTVNNTKAWNKYAFHIPPWPPSHETRLLYRNGRGRLPPQMCPRLTGGKRSARRLRPAFGPTRDCQV